MRYRNSYDATDEDAEVHYRYDDIETARSKYLINYVLPNGVKSALLDELFLDVIEDENSFCNKWYMSENEVNILQREFQCIGSHAWTHRPLATLKKKDVIVELKDSKALLEKITGSRIHALSYPFGNPHAVGTREVICAQKAGYKIGFTMNRIQNVNLENPLSINRFDCNDIFHKKKSKSKM